MHYAIFITYVLINIRQHHIVGSGIHIICEENRKNNERARAFNGQQPSVSIWLSSREEINKMLFFSGISIICAEKLLYHNCKLLL